MLRYYTYLNKGLQSGTMVNGFAQGRFKGSIKWYLSEDTLYPIIHIEGHDIEVAFTHVEQYGEDYFSFVNGHILPKGVLIRQPFGRHL